MNITVENVFIRNWALDDSEIKPVESEIALDESEIELDESDIALVESEMLDICLLIVFISSSVFVSGS